MIHKQLPKSGHDLVAEVPPTLARSASSLATSSGTRRDTSSARVAEVEINQAGEVGPCSAWLTFRIRYKGLLFLFVSHQISCHNKRICSLIRNDHYLCRTSHLVNTNTAKQLALSLSHKLIPRTNYDVSLLTSKQTIGQGSYSLDKKAINTI